MRSLPLAISAIALAVPALSEARLPVATFAAGNAFACAAIPTEGVSCWGANSVGQLGDGSTVDRLTPVSVQGLAGEVTALAAGLNHACALLQSGQVRCWGANGEGQIGDGTTNTRLAATAVAGLPAGAIAIAAGGSTTCAVTPAGEMKCWGRVQSGAATSTFVAAPVTVTGLEQGVTGLAVGATHACALVLGGTVRCWGANDRGQLGDNTTTPRATPAAVAGWGSGITFIAAGDEQTCAVRGGNVECTGVVDFVANRDVISTQPILITGVSDVQSLTAGAWHTCALTRGGVMRCWGFNRYGQLGDGTTAIRYRTAADLQGLPGRVVGMGSGWEFSCAALDNGRATCWGENRFGQVGDGGGGHQSAPVDILFANYQGLWWKSPAASESGWGVNISHQANTLFATWFTYDASGNPLWLVMPNGARVSEGRYTGAVYTTTGPAFNSATWNSALVTATQRGAAAFQFSNPDNGRFEYVVDGVTQIKEITRQVYATPPRCYFGAPPGFPPNAQDLWWAAPAGSESGWGINIAHQGNILFVTWFTYDAAGRPQWMVMPNASQLTSVTYRGDVYRTRGPAFSAAPWQPSQVAATLVGTANINFTDADNAAFAYTVDGVTRTRAITRQVFATPRTQCR